MWRGLTVAPEYRCSPYDSDDYRYAQSVEPRIVASMDGIIYGPYTGTVFDSTSETDIEHIVARSEAHDSGLCKVDAATKRRFASDLINLTLASPSVNRSQKSGKDAAEWLPNLNQCWFANRVVEVRQQYGLTVDPRERDVLEGVLSGCTSTSMVMQGPGLTLEQTPAPTPSGVLGMYDENGDGRITCAEARQHGIAPVSRNHPAYQYMNDADDDGVVCETSGSGTTSRPTPTPVRGGGSGGALQMYDDNGNGRITCAEARRHGIAPVHRGHPAYRYMDDRDNDGVVCE